MRLHSIFARFYRSLNFDFIRASHAGYEPDPWDSTPEGDYPFVRIKLQSGITTIVGANESGKSQVLRAVEAALTGEGFEQSDFCRYSKFFGVDKELLLPEFGALYSAISAADVQTIATATGQTSLSGVDRLAVFRMNQAPKIRAYVRQSGSWSEPFEVANLGALDLSGIPVPFRIDADVPLPDTVPIQFLATGDPVGGVGREVLRSVWENLLSNRSWFDTDTTVQAHATAISASFRSVRSASTEELKGYRLAADLLLKVAGVQRDLFTQLQSAVATKNGYANSIVDTINSELSSALNFPHWWSQDAHFELFVSLYEFDLVFMIRDRTGRSYGFDERSDGMKYFLSYFVQYLSHEARADGRPEILLMDEPDRFLSSSGQQDLLRIFNDFADPNDSARAPVQVVYVTHSPFLIDKNEADRIRVLEKGEYDEGTRVVSSTSANHYEPLRSAFGSFVAETAFIGNCNLMVEGASDQVLLAGASRWLKSRGVAERDRIDLNRITIVPAGGTPHIPYLVYLARGRDVEKPPVIVLLDNDPAGDTAKLELAVGGAYGGTLIDSSLVLQLGQDDLRALKTENPFGIVGIEDVVPFDIALLAARAYCAEFVPDVQPELLDLSAENVFPDTVPPVNKGTLKYLEIAIGKKAKRASFHLDKVAFARAVVDVMTGASAAAAPELPSKKLEDNFRLLLAVLALRQRQAERAESAEKISSRINRAKRDFVRTHPGQARKEAVSQLIEEIGNQLDASVEAEECRSTMRTWQMSFKLDEDPRTLVDDYRALIKALDSLAYQAVRSSALR